MAAWWQDPGAAAGHGLACAAEGRLKLVRGAVHAYMRARTCRQAFGWGMRRMMRQTSWHMQALLKDALFARHASAHAGGAAAAAAWRCPQRAARAAAIGRAASTPAERACHAMQGWGNQGIKEGRKEGRKEGECVRAGAGRRVVRLRCSALHCTALQVRAAAWSLPSSRSPCMHAGVDAPTATLRLLVS